MPRKFFPVRFILKTVLATLFLIWGSQSAMAAEDYVFINISNPFLHKTPIAVPPFQSAGTDEETAEIVSVTSRLVAYYLDFTGYFSITNPAAFLEDPTTMDITGAAIQYRNWTAIGAELLITGGVTVQGDTVEFDLRLFDTVKQKNLLGKRYRGNKADHAQVARRFCGEVLYTLFGTRGMFGSRLAFVSNGSGHKEIYLCDFDGTNITPFTQHNSISLFPDWSSDGRWIAYTTYEGRHPRIYIRNIAENRISKIEKEFLQISPAWVPGKFELAASLSFSGDQEIYLLTGSGKLIKRLTHSADIDVEPTWSPDGKFMAFVSKRSGSPQVYILDTTTDRVRRLTFEGNYNTQPSWSPSGDKIAYSSMAGGIVNIFTIHPDGGNPVQLTKNQGSNEAPSWSPDGSLIAFSSTREGGHNRIYVMTAYGTDQRRLLVMPGEQTNPKWSPNFVTP
ncbi:Tol-Pal system beta propeller repeat protein TolB [Desulfosarcina sp. OttesenSCG-928-G10]|nr:Tol-Pal system beta propeller repeat protein TolB [Desulfosarcina sp. OttesenSCG-928-G10]MDL2320787.1 Tol-Pal system beta propeller repeat protein TolB [Desulfosarcina sp. OttesenSCG-928-B08]